MCCELEPRHSPRRRVPEKNVNLKLNQPAPAAARARPRPGLREARSGTRSSLSDTGAWPAVATAGLSSAGDDGSFKFSGHGSSRLG